MSAQIMHLQKGGQISMPFCSDDHDGGERARTWFSDANLQIAAAQTQVRATRSGHEDSIYR
jgi:hypothetical protein